MLWGWCFVWRGFLSWPKEIAKKLEVSESQVSAWINGKTYPRAVKLFRLAKLLEVKVDDLYELQENAE
nr:helix-turn-helix transcriptional regulator [Melghirimyces profundicolus]